MRPHPRQHPISLYLVTSPRSPPLFGLHWADLHVPFLRKIKQFLFWERLRFNRIFKTSNTGVTLMVRIRFTLAGIRVFLVKMVFFLSPVPPPSFQLYGCHSLRIRPASPKSLFDVTANWDSAVLLLVFISLHCSLWVPCSQPTQPFQLKMEIDQSLSVSREPRAHTQRWIIPFIEEVGPWFQVISGHLLN